MRDESSNRHARRSQARPAPKDRSLHWHVGESVFRVRQDAVERARTIANDMRGIAEPGSYLGYVVSVADAVEELCRVESCDRSCEM